MEPEYLEPCPFCCGEAKIVGSQLDGYFVTCTTCHAGSARMRTLEEAVQRWNTRSGEDPHTWLKQYKCPACVHEGVREYCEYNVRPGKFDKWVCKGFRSSPTLQWYERTDEGWKLREVPT